MFYNTYVFNQKNLLNSKYTSTFNKSKLTELLTIKNYSIMTKTISFNDLRRIKDSLPDGSISKIADKLNTTPQTVRNYFGGSNYEFGKNCGVHIEPGPDGGIVVLDDTTIYDMAIEILQEQEND